MQWLYIEHDKTDTHNDTFEGMPTSNPIPHTSCQLLEHDFKFCVYRPPHFFN